MAKQYHLGAGCNVGKRSKFKMEELEDLIYSSDLMDYFDKNQVEIKWFYLRQQHGKAHRAATRSPEYERWTQAHFDDKTGELICTHREQFDVILHCMGDDYAKIADDYFTEYKENSRPIITTIQGVYENAKNKPKQTALKIEGGKAVLDGQYLIHKFPMSKNAQDYESRKENGIIASEFFGKTENMKEGVFCSFFSKCDGIQPGSLKEENSYAVLPAFREKIEVDSLGSLTLIFDASDPTVKEVLDNDFFEYKKNKDNPEYMSKLTKEQVDMFEYIEKLSDGADEAVKRHPEWVAIPGGMPPQFVVGIMIDGEFDSEDKYLAEKTAQAFGVPLINRDLEVVYAPKTKAQLLAEDAEMFKKYDEQRNRQQKVIKNEPRNDYSDESIEEDEIAMAL